MELKKDYSHFITSVGIHVAILAVMIGSFEFASTMPVIQQSNDAENVIQASVINTVPPKKTLPLPALPKAEPKPAEPAPPKPVEKTPPPAPEVKAKEDTIAIPIKKVVEKKVIPKPKLEFGKDLLADLKKQVDQKKVVKQKSLKTVFANSLEQQLSQEQNAMDAAKTLQMQGVINKYKALILQTISHNWIVPPYADKKASSQLLIRLAPGGMVLDVQIVKSSGDPALDRSARAAVFKASPLPVPSKSDEFEPFRQFSLKVKPESLLASGQTY